MLDLKWRATDNGFCRVYYTAKGRRGVLYCMQLSDGRTGNFECLLCSRDGEPSVPVRPGCISSIERPGSDERIEVELNAFLDRCPLALINARDVPAREHSGDAAGK